jgi:hypothetical protein
MAVSSISRRTPARPPGFGQLFTDAAAAMWASAVPWLPTRAGFWAMMVGRPFVLARVRPDGPTRFRSAAD